MVVVEHDLPALPAVAHLGDLEERGGDVRELPVVLPLKQEHAVGVVYQIEVKGHRPDTPEIKVRGPQVRQAKQNPERFRLAVVRVPHEPIGRPAVSYFIRPFDTYELHFAQAYVPLNIADLMPYAVEPQ